MVSPQIRDIKTSMCSKLVSIENAFFDPADEIHFLNPQSIKELQNTLDDELLGFLHKRTKQCHAWFLIGFCCLKNVWLTWDIFGPVDEVD